MTGDTPRIDRTSDRPAWKQLADILRGKIHSGELRGGDNLPSEGELSSEYGVGRNTVKQALNQLKADGLVLSERGRPWWVRPVQLLTASRYAAAKTNYHPDTDSKFAAQHGVSWGDFDLDREYLTVPASPRVAAALRIAAGADVVERRWTHRIDDVVMRVAWSYLDPVRFAGTVIIDPDEPAWPGGTIAQLRHLGYDVSTVHIEVGLRRAGEAEARYLQVDVGTPMLEIWRAQVVDGRAVEVARHLYPERAGQVLVFDVNVSPAPSWGEWHGRSYD